MTNYFCPVCEQKLLEIDANAEEDTIAYKLYEEGGRFWCPSCFINTGKVTSYVIQSEDEKEENEDEDNNEEDE